jgi:hypothetical protein
MVRCAECGKLGEGSMKGWRAMLGIDIDDENAATETYLFCPECAQRDSALPKETEASLGARNAASRAKAR